MQANMVEVDCSDDDDSGALSSTVAPHALIAEASSSSTATTAPFSSRQSLPMESRNFWKAGNYAVAPINSAPLQGQLDHARVHPKFLHSNATSHKWAFGAIAELLDNAVDEICNGATFVKVDKVNIMKDGSPSLLFQDDGGGMDPEGIRKCMSLGYSSKKTETTIGQYGNGFKTSTMRLGADVIVFSRAVRSGKSTQSVGLLSYTYLRQTAQDDVIVPMVDFDIFENDVKPIIYGTQHAWDSNLRTILEWSPFECKDKLMMQFNDIGSHGTKVFIYNLWLNDEGVYELSFDEDTEDIRLRDEANRGTRQNNKISEIQSHISYRIRYSLRAYSSMLYLKKFKHFRIILRGIPVQQFNIADELRHAKRALYRPQLGIGSGEVTVETKIGFIKEAPTLKIRGFNVYHKNRLIKPFWKVTSDASSRGSGVCGVLEANFIKPAHDKQDFERSALFVRLEGKLKDMISEYWNHNCHFIGMTPPGSYIQDKVKDPQAKSQIRLDSKKLQNNQPLDGLAATTSVINRNSNQSADRLDSDALQIVIHEDGDAAMSIDEIREQNIQLLTKCEEHRQKRDALKRTVEELEKELQETKQKCAHLSAQVESRKRLHATMKQLS
uniref:Morc S5 domain-containing protein n=1 Tax=Kalanchoe fedtschenkoi TaxID=63787 RepID=A0A7N0TEG0_KALFE